MPDGTAFEGWAVLELMGHRRHVGYVQEAAMFDSTMLSIDVLSYDIETEEFSQRRQYYGGSSVYCLTPVTEDEARAAVKPSWLPSNQLPAAGDTEPPPSFDGVEF
jgi:hypothetical protein